MVFKVIPKSILGDEFVLVVVEWYGGMEYGEWGARAKGYGDHQFRGAD